MGEQKDQTQKSSDKISNGHSMSFEEFGRLLAAGSKGKNHYKALLDSANEMKLIYEAYKEAGFSDEQAFNVVLTLLSAALRSR